MLYPILLERISTQSPISSRGIDNKCCLLPH
jgi:hypothetical protein